MWMMRGFPCRGSGGEPFVAALMPAVHMPFFCAELSGASTILDLPFPEKVRFSSSEIQIALQGVRASRRRIPLLFLHLNHPDSGLCLYKIVLLIWSKIALINVFLAAFFCFFPDFLLFF